MEYFDQQIIEMRQNEKEKKHTTLETGIYVNRKLIEFEPDQLFDGQIEMMLPAAFIDMPKIVAKVKYPSEYRPQIIKTSLDGTVNLTFNLLEVTVEDQEGLEEVAARFQAVIKQVNPVIKVKNQQIHHKNQNYQAFSYKSYGIDRPIFNLVCLTPVKDKLLQLCFNCPDGEQEKWENITNQIFQTIKVKI